MAHAGELRQMDDAELVTRLLEAKEEMFNLRFQHATGQLDNMARLGQVRRDIARLATVIREREIEAAETPGGATPAPAPAAKPKRSRAKADAGDAKADAETPDTEAAADNEETSE